MSEGGARLAGLVTMQRMLLVLDELELLLHPPGPLGARLGDLVVDLRSYYRNVVERSAIETVDRDALTMTGCGTTGLSPVRNDLSLDPDAVNR